MKRLSLAAAIPLLAFGLAACNDEVAQPPVPPLHAPSFAWVDGSNGGNPHFYFLPPLVPSPSYTGVFDPDLAPTVTVCKDLTVTAVCSNPLSGTGTNSSAKAIWYRGVLGPNIEGGYVEQPSGSEVYQANWKPDLYKVTNNTVLRIMVTLGNTLLGYIDVQKLSTGWITTSDGAALPGGNSNIPIKFRIEQLALCGSTDCTQHGVIPGVETTIQLDGVAALHFDGDEISQPINVTITLVTGEKCLPTDLQQFGACIHLEKDFDGNFLNMVDAVVCLTESAGQQYLDDDQLRLWKWSERDGDQMEEPPPGATVDSQGNPLVNCNPITAFQNSSPTVRRLAHLAGTVFHPIMSLIGPKPLFAGAACSGCLSCSLSTFSRIGFVRPLAIQIQQGDNQTAKVGTTVPIDPTVLVTAKYGSRPPVSAKTVNFTPSPDGTATPPTALTDAFGLASTVWQLSTTAGPNTLLADVPTSTAEDLTHSTPPYLTQVTFNATARDLQVKWLSPLTSKSTITGAYQSGLASDAVVNVYQYAPGTQPGGAPLASLAVTEGGNQYQTNWDIPPLDATQYYRVIAVVSGKAKSPYVDLMVVNNELRNVQTGEKVLNLKNSRKLPIKFQLLY